MGVHFLLPFAEAMVLTYLYICLLYCYLAFISLLESPFCFSFLIVLC